MDPEPDLLPCPHTLFSSAMPGCGYCLGCGVDAAVLALQVPVLDVERQIENAERAEKVGR